MQAYNAKEFERSRIDIQSGNYRDMAIQAAFIGIVLFLEYT